jgi:hypothetical protein
MTRRLPVTLTHAALRLLLSAACLLPAGAALAQTPAPGTAPPVAAPSAPPSPTAPDAVPGPETAPSAPSLPPQADPEASAAIPSSDHDRVVGRWGVDAPRPSSPKRFPASCPDAQSATCERVEMNAFSLRRWTDHDYAWNVGLAFALGGGGQRQGGSTKTMDTYFGVGPTLGASFLLANWRHMAVSAGPKSIEIFARGLVEGELHLGFLGLPAVTVGVLTGLEGALRVVTSAGDLAEGDRAVEWSLATRGPTSLWGVATNAFVRVYF